MRAGLLLLLWGCQSDAPVDAVDADTSICAGDPRGLLPNTCFTATQARSPTVVIATDDESCTPLASHPELCVVIGDAVTIDSPLRVRGSRPLVIWSATTITITAGGELDADSGGVLVGAGGNDASCPSNDGSADTSMNPQIGSGGCGGGFGGRGGSGGAGSDGAGRVIASACESPLQPLDRIRGGCRGGHGGLSDSLDTPPNGGSSGGGVYLIAREQIIVHGTITANGGPGLVARANANLVAAGGGGGSGGFIGLDAPVIDLSGGTLVALGAGGSSGTGVRGSALPGFFGRSPGQDPPAFAMSSPQTVDTNFGGGGGIDGQPGGDVVTTEIGGGGGGGGGVGYIRVFSQSLITDGAQILPPLD